MPTEVQLIMRVYSIVVSLACLVGVQCLNTKLTLPWGTWEASQLFEHKDVSVTAVDPSKICSQS